MRAGYALLVLLAAFAAASVKVVTPAQRLLGAQIPRPARTAPWINKYFGSSNQSLAHIWDALPEFMGSLSPSSAASWADQHFSYTAVTRVEGSDVFVDFKLERLSTGAVEYLFITAGGLHTHLFMTAGAHTIHFKDMTALEIEDVKLSSIRAFRFHGIVDSAKSLVQLAFFFVGLLETKIVTPYTKELSLEYMREWLNFDMVERTGAPDVTLSESDANVGDVMAITRLDGLDPCVLWFTGGRVAHMVVVWVDEDGRKVVCESQDAAYWPLKGVQCNPWDQWVKWAIEGEYNVVMLPLDPKIRARLNVSAGLEYFNSVKGDGYGYQSFLAAGFDTLDQNIPPPLTEHTLDLFGAVMSVVSFKTGSQILYQPAAKRCGLPENSSWAEVLVGTERQYGSLMRAMVEVESDQYTYGGQPARVCSSFAMDILKHAGAFGDADFNAAEQTPHDVTELAIYDTAYAAPAACVRDDPQLAAQGYCQLLGRNRVDLGPSYNSWPMHDHLGERCPSVSHPADC